MPYKHQPYIFIDGYRNYLTLHAIKMFRKRCWLLFYKSLKGKGLIDEIINRSKRLRRQRGGATRKNRKKRYMDTTFYSDGEFRYVVNHKEDLVITIEILIPYKKYLNKY